MAMLCIAQAAHARSAAPESGQTLSPASEPAPDSGIVVTAASHRGAALGDPRPVAVINAETLRAFEGATIADLIRQLKHVYRGSGQDQAQLLLLDGRRVVNDADIYDIPREAILRIDVLPEQEAERYGVKRGSPVINFVLKPDFHNRAATVKSGVNSGGPRAKGGTAYGGEASYFAISDHGRITIVAKWDDAAPVYAPPEAALPFAATPPAAGLFAIGQNPLPQSGAAITRTLAAASSTFDFALTASRNLGADLTGTGTVTVNATHGVGLVGPAEPDLLVSVTAAGNGPALVQRESGFHGHAGVAVSAAIGRWTTSLLAGFDNGRTHSDTQIGVLVRQPGVVLASIRNITETSLASLGLHGNGTIMPGPAGPITADLALDATTGTTTVVPVANSGGYAANYPRTDIMARANINLPLLDRSAESRMPGTLSASAGVAWHRVSGFGLLGEGSLGLNWMPTPALALSASFTTARAAPAVQQLAGATVVTPNMQVFDFTSGQTVLATVTFAGNPRLRATTTRSLAFDASYQFPAAAPLGLTFGYTRTQLADQSMDIPVATTALEQNFPAFFARDQTGQLVGINAVPVNIARETRDDVRWGLTWSRGVSSGDDADPVVGRGKAVMISLAVNHVWHLQDRLRIGPASKVTDVLAGAGGFGTTGVARHECDVDVNVTRAGLGIHGSARWIGGSRVGGGGGAVPDLVFSPALRTDLAVFVDLSMLFRDWRWAQATRLTLSLTNPVGGRQHVRGSSLSSLPGLDLVALAGQLRAAEAKLRIVF